MQVVTKKSLSEAQFRVLLSAQLRLQQVTAAYNGEQERFNEIITLLTDALGVNLATGKVELLTESREIQVTTTAPDPVLPPAV